MASTSASSVQRSFKYDVFLSFRGEDTRKNFVDHLYHALQQKNITTYKDDEKIEKGEKISDQLTRSIQDSRFYIIVFSKNYASSSWCLDELVKIMECQKTKEQTAYPVFYDVEPTEVRNQSGAVGEAFAKLMEKEAAGRWGNALKEAAGLAGWELRNTVDGHEAKFIQKVVIDISLKLSFINWSVDDNLVGMETRAKKVVSSLEIGIEDVRMIGIKGMGGDGKTTLATAVFDHISIWFEGISFIENVREVSKSSLSGLKELQKQLLSDVLNDQSIVVRSVSDGKNKVRKVMGSRKVLVVLDDVDKMDQLEALVGKPSWFKPGSRIIITTRDEQVLVAHRVNFIHDVNLLSYEEAIYLFSRYAFGRDIPIEGYEELSEKVVHYAAGLPLTIKVLGSHLCGRSECEWVDALKRLKTIPLKETLEKLELSYDGLENDQKEIFLDVACIQGMRKKEAIRILESCGLHAELGLRVLEQKSLLTISYFNKLLLHDHLEEMGKNIVRCLHPDEPNKHNRLWIAKEIEDILVNDLGTKAIRSIKLWNTKLHPSIIMKGLKKMTKLRFMHVDDIVGWKLDEVGPYLPNTLQSLHWLGYPYRCLPTTFQANKLVNLQIKQSNISQLWEGGEKKVLNELRFFYLKDVKLRSFDFGMTPNLETFHISACAHFEEIHMPVECPKLKSLKLTYYKVRNLNLGLIPNLIKLSIIECCDELHMPIECLKLESLKLISSKVSSLNLRLTPNLEELSIYECQEFDELHMPIECLKLKSLELISSKVSSLNLRLTPNLEELLIDNCQEFEELHMPIECPRLKSVKLISSKVSSLNLRLTPNLEELLIYECQEFDELHMPIECLKLKSLELISSKVSSLNLRLTPNLEELSIYECREFEELHMPIECPRLKSVKLMYSKVSSLNLKMTPNLEVLSIKECCDFEELHMPIECPRLKSVELMYSKVSSLNLEMTPNLEVLSIEKFCDFEELHMPIECPRLKSVKFISSKVSNLNLELTPNLEVLFIQECQEFEELHMHIECPRLKSVKLISSKVSSLNLRMTPNVEVLLIDKCQEFEELHMPIECPRLKSVKLISSKA